MVLKLLHNGMGLLECSYSPWVLFFLIYKLGWKIVVVISDQGGGCFFKEMMSG